MAATRLIPLHVNKGKTVAQCLADRTDYSENEKKTNNGEFMQDYLIARQNIEAILGAEEKEREEKKRER